jgi:hypothetical protein
MPTMRVGYRQHSVKEGKASGKGKDLGAGLMGLTYLTISCRI